MYLKFSEDDVDVLTNTYNIEWHQVDKDGAFDPEDEMMLY